MADTKISELTSITGANVNDTTDELAIVDASTNTTKAITREELFQDVLKIKVGGGADGGNNADELVASKDQTNVGMSILSEDSTGFSRLLFGTQTDTSAAKVQYTASSDEIILQSGGIVTLQSGGTNDRVTIDSSGNVGIGTTSPSENLHVVSANGTALRLEATNTSTAGGIDFYGKDGGGTTYQAGNINAAGGSGSLEFSADPTDAETNTRVTFLTDGTERVRIDDTGLGIGTSSPSAPLDVTGTVKSTVSSTGDFNFDAISSGGGNYRIYPDDATTANPTWLHQSNSSEDQAWVIGGVERMRIASDGKVGIGTNSPTSAALVVSGTGLDSSIRVADTTNSVNVDVRADATGGLVRTASNDPLVFATNQNEAMRIDSSGNVGIGTTSPAEALDVTGTGLFSGRVGIGTDLGSNPSGADPDADNLVIDAGGADAGITIDTGTAAKGSLFFADGGTGDALKRGQIVYDHNGDYMAFATNAVERMRLISSGAKIGTGADASSNGDEFVISKDQTNVGMSVLTADGTGFARIFLGSQTDTQAASIRHSENNDRLFVQAKGDIYFQTGGTSTTATLNTDGDLDVTGALSKGSGSFKIDHPLKPDTHHLVHSFIEGPQADNLYRGTVALVGGAATVNLDTAGRMSEGTFVALNGNVQCFTSNEQGWTAVRGSVSGNILTIEAQDSACTDTVSWMVVGERHDQHMIDTAWTDAQGRVITEPKKVEDTQEEAA